MRPTVESGLTLLGRVSSHILDSLPSVTFISQPDPKQIRKDEGESAFPFTLVFRQFHFMVCLELGDCREPVRFQAHFWS